MKKINFIILLLLFATTSTALAGNDGGNGGGVIVCLEKNGSKTVELLDLREYEKQNKIKIQRSKIYWKTQLEQALHKYSIVNPDYVKRMRAELEIIEKRWQPVAYRLPPPTDTSISELQEPRNCFLEGVASYDDAREVLFIDQQLESLMSETDRAALRFHEAWYRVQRLEMTPPSSSQKTREITGLIFSSEPLIYESANRSPNQSISFCRSTDGLYEFYIRQNSSSSQYEVEFLKISGLQSNEKIRAYLNDILHGFILKKSAAPKAEQADRGVYQLPNSFRSMSFYVNPTLLPPLWITISHSNWISFWPDNLTLQYFENLDSSLFRNAKKNKTATLYENALNLISVYKGPSGSTQTSQFSCSRTP